MGTTQIEGLWAYIQTLSLSNRNKQWLADKLLESKKESVSPSNDPWFEQEENIEMLNKSISEEKSAKEYSLESIADMLGHGV